MTIKSVSGNLRFSSETPRQRPGLGGLAYSTLEGRTLLSIAEAIFELEEYSKQSKVRSLQIALEPSALKIRHLPQIGACLTRLAEYVLLTKIRIAFTAEANVSDSLQFDQHRPQFDACCLFSGGVDSLSGILSSARKYGSVTALFCGHSHQARITHVVRNLYSDYLSKESIAYAEIAAPPMLPTGYSQLRGAFYMLAGAAYASQTASKTVVIAECGPTMYQTRFGGFDSVTMTTHPFVVARCLEIGKMLLGREFCIELPFENHTKAEVAALCRNASALKHTHSCISQRFGSHDGTCYGCVIRRLAFLAAGIRDVKYNRDPICDATANASNLLAVLDFSANMLRRPKRLALFQVQIIDEFGKHDLFRRFALDNLAGIRALETRGKRVVAGVKQIYADAVAALGGNGKLDDRIVALKQLASTAD